MINIFVFGSNLAGRHGMGAARHALRSHGATYGVGEGIQGESYAIPTKDHALKPLPLDEIKKYVDIFKEFARDHQEYRFSVTRVGCGLAGYTDEQIAPMFVGCPSNCDLPDEWVAIYDRTRDEKLDYYEYLLSGRAGKLLKKGKFFVVVAEDEPYFREVYNMIRENEIAIGRWTDEDEEQYRGKPIVE